jgi:hypothetical protein
VTPRRATALLTAVAVLLAPTAARADGDPASDILLLQDAYLPYFPAPAKPLAQTLTRLLAQVRKAGYPMKVALIESAGDLGAYPEMLGKPEPYAKLLESELAFKVKRPHLLVVMPGGFAGRNLGPEATAALAKVQIDQGAKSDGLVRAALEAVARTATANGHPTQVPDVKSAAKQSGDGGSSNTLLYVIAGIIVLLGIALVAVSVRSRQDVLGEQRDDGD